MNRPAALKIFFKSGNSVVYWPEDQKEFDSCVIRLMSCMKDELASDSVQSFVQVPKFRADAVEGFTMIDPAMIYDRKTILFCTVVVKGLFWAAVLVCLVMMAQG